MFLLTHPSIIWDEVSSIPVHFLQVSIFPLSVQSVTEMLLKKEIIFLYNLTRLHYTGNLEYILERIFDIAN